MSSLHDNQQTPSTPQPEAGKRTVEIIVNGKPVQVPVDDTGRQIKQAAGAPDDYQLFRITGATEQLIADDEQLHVHDHERFLAAPPLDPAQIAVAAHEVALASVREAFPDHRVQADELPDGCTRIVICDVEIGPGWRPAVIDLETRLAVTFPSSPPYPYYGPAGLARTDGRGVPVTMTTLDGQPRTQISLNKPFDATVETLGARLMAVLAWMRA